jgi:HK97 family phage major capsid protein
MSAIDIENFLSGELEYQFRLAEERAFLNGDGNGKPLGVFVPDASGIPNTRDKSTAAAMIAADDIIDTFFELKGNYRARASWIGSRNFIKAVAKLKDGQGQYIWSAVEGPGQAIVNGPMGILLGRPLYESEDAPSALTAGTYAAILGDFAHYRIFDFMGLAIQVLDQDPYASNGEYGYVGHKFVDGNVDLADAFIRLKMKV